MLINTDCSLYGMDFYAAAIKYAVASPNISDHYPDVDELNKTVFANGKANYSILCS
jgi:hypothetical protein